MGTLFTYEHYVGSSIHASIPAAPRTVLMWVIMDILQKGSLPVRLVDDAGCEVWVNKGAAESYGSLKALAVSQGISWPPELEEDAP